MSEKKQFIKPNQDYTPEGDSALLQQNIEMLGLSEYTLAKLKNVGIEKNIDLARCQMKHFYKIPGMNKKNIFEVLKKMQAVGLDFKRSPVAATTTEDVGGENSEAVNENKIQNNVKTAPANNNRDKKDKFAKEKKSDNTNKDKVLEGEQNASNAEQSLKADKKKKFEKNKSRDNKNNKDFKDNREIKDVRDSRENRQGKEVRDLRDAKKVDNLAVQKNADEQNRQQNQNKKAILEKKQNVQPSKSVKSQPVKMPTEPKRMKVNSYDLDSILNDNPPLNKKTLKQEREEKIAKAIKDLPPIKNADGLYKFYKHGKWGYKTESGKVVIEPAFTEAFNFKEGLACVEQNERCGFIDKTGEVVIPIQYDTACSFSEGLASVTKGDKCGYIDKEGNVVFDFIYDAATSFENDIALVKKDGKWGYMDRKTGEIRLR